MKKDVCFYTECSTSNYKTPRSTHYCFNNKYKNAWNTFQSCIENNYKTNIFLCDFGFSWRSVWRLESSGMYRRIVTLKWTDVSEVRTASIIITTSQKTLKLQRTHLLLLISLCINETRPDWKTDMRHRKNWAELSWAEFLAEVKT
jgi:hypothetical protein